MVKSNVRSMPKDRRKVDMSPELRRQIDDVLLHADETRREFAEVVAQLRVLQAQLRLVLASR
jgi:hypothetical protein